MGIKKKVAKKKAKKKTTQKPKVPKIRVSRSGAESTSYDRWTVVDQNPTISHNPGWVYIRSNIAVDKNAERQSEIQIRIPDDALIDLLEAQFRIKGWGIGDLVRQINATKETANELLSVLDWFRNGWGYYGLQNIAEDEKVFDKESLKDLRAAKAHDWKMNT